MSLKFPDISNKPVQTVSSRYGNLVADLHLRNFFHAILKGKNVFSLTFEKKASKWLPTAHFS